MRRKGDRPVLRGGGVGDIASLPDCKPGVQARLRECNWYPLVRAACTLGRVAPASFPTGALSEPDNEKSRIPPSGSSVVTSRGHSVAEAYAP